MKRGRPPPRGCVVEVGATDTICDTCGALGCRCIQYKGRCDCVERCRLAEMAAGGVSSASSSPAPSTKTTLPSSKRDEEMEASLKKALEAAAAVRSSGIGPCGCSDESCNCKPGCGCLATQCPCCGRKIGTGIGQQEERKEEVNVDPTMTI